MPVTGELDRTLAVLVGVLAAVYLVRCCAGLLLYVASLIPGSAGRSAKRLSARVTPRLVRKALITVTGVAIAGGGVALPAHAEAPPRAGHSAVPLPDLDRVPTNQQHRTQRPPPRVPEASSVTVETGDCLWTLASSQLAAAHQSTSDSAIEDQWHRWYRANRDEIGSDPNLIYPGTKLRIPAIPQERGN